MKDLNLKLLKIENKINKLKSNKKSYYNDFKIRKLNEKKESIINNKSYSFEFYFNSLEFKKRITLNKINKLNSKEKKDENKIKNEEEYLYDLINGGVKEANKNRSIKKSKEKRKMILTGDILKTILVICIPLALYQLFNSIYTLIDQILCAKISTTAQNAVSSISQIKSAISAFGAGLAAGGAVLVSRRYGAGDVKEARHASSNLFFMSLVMSGILMLILIPLAEPIMRLCQIAPASIEIGVSYFRLQLFELALIAINNIFIGLEKAKGNSKMILFLNLGVLIIKLGFTVLFLFGFGLKDIKYVELATIIGQLLLASIGMFKLFSRNNILRLSFKMLLPKKEYVLPILKLSIPIFIGKFVMSMGKVVVNGMCGRYWNTLTDGLIVGTLGVSNNMCGLITSPTNSFEEGESSIVSQNIGAKNIKRAMRTFFKTLILATSVSLLGYCLMRFVFIDELVSLFSSSDDKSDIYMQMVKEIFKWDSLSIIALGITAAVLGLLYGFGQTALSTVLNFSRIGSRMLILFIIHKAYPDLRPTLAAGLSMGISNIVILLLSVIFLIIFIIRIKIKGYKGLRFEDPEPSFNELKDEENNLVSSNN